MRYLLSGLILFLMAAEVFQWDVSMGPGLSIRNAMLYVILMFLMFRIAIERSQKLEAGPIHLGFTALIAYAVVTWLVAALIIEYPGYDLIEGGIRLKSELIDQFIYFLVFYYGTTSKRDATMVVTSVLLAAVFANAMTVADVMGYIDLGFQERESGRTEGALGEANEYAAFIILFLPGLIAAMLLARGLWRAFWLGAVLVSAVALIMTVSRGAFVGLLVAGFAGAWLYRDRLSIGKVAAWLIAAVILVTLAVSLSQYTAVLEERLFSQSGSIDMNEVSSGRVDIWRALFERMIATPITFLTGFGWEVYPTMPFRFAPHNHYFSFWFNLGLPGLLFGVLVLASAVLLAKRASDLAEPDMRPRLIGFVIGTMAVCVAVSFVELFVVWRYFWAYAGLAMRLAMTVRSEADVRVSAVRTAPASPREARAALGTDSYGWVARPQGGGELRSQEARR